MKAPDRVCDLLVIGAGPCGSSAAWHAARAGLRVLVVEKAAFPRDKLCGDFLAPGCVDFLRTSGLGHVAEELNPVPLTGTRLVYRGRSIPMAFPEGHRGWSVGRRELDAALVAAVRGAGVEVMEETRVESVQDVGDAVMARARTNQGDPLTVEARALLDAGGRHALLPRIRRWHRPARWPVRFGLGAWYEGVRGLEDHVEMHVVKEGYVGISPLDPATGLAGAAAVVPPAALPRMRGDASGLLEDLMASSDELKSRFSGSRPVSRVRGAGPLAHRARLFARGRELLAGDAAGFVDPFTGEGIQAALRGGALAAAAATEMVANGGTLPARSHDQALSRLLTPRFAMARTLQGLLSAPPLAARVAEALIRRPDLADSMVAVTGGLKAPSTLLRPGHLLPLLRETFSLRSPRPARPARRRAS